MTNNNKDNLQDNDTKIHKIVNLELNNSWSLDQLKKVISEDYILPLDSFYSELVEPGKICIKTINDEVLYVHRSSESLKIYYQGKYIIINCHTHDFLFNDGKISIISNEMESGIESLREFLNTLSQLKKEYRNQISYDLVDLHYSIGLIDYNSYKMVISDDDIALMLPDFRKQESFNQSLTIITKDYGKIVGFIEFNLSDNNFSYQGNVAYQIFPQFQNEGYAPKALNLVKRLVLEYSDFVDKNLYIAMLPEDIYSESVAQECGGKLYYEGLVPKSDKLSFLGKIKDIKIYKIGDNNEKIN